MKLLLPVFISGAILTQQSAQTPLQRLQASVEATTRSVNATWGIYVKSLESGEEIAINGDRQMETMSTIKIPLMIEVLEQVKAGKFKLADKYTFAQADSQPGTGTIQRLDAGAVMRYLTDHWANRLEKNPRVKILTSRLPNQSWGLANISLQGVDSQKAYESLWSKYRIITASIKHAEYQGLRITPNIYTTLQELDTFGDAIEEMLKAGTGTAA